MPQDLSPSGSGSVASFANHIFAKVCANIFAAISVCFIYFGTINLLRMQKGLF
jgi:hypothetical protein